MTFATSYIISLVYLILCCGPVQPEVSVKVSPKRSQYFPLETISLSCEEDGKPVSWSVRRNTSKKVNAACGGWGKTDGESCTIQRPYASEDSGVYWCQSKTEELSQSINITISDVILQSPVLPVPEGGEATFRCLSKDQTTGQPSSDLPADFYRNGSLFRAESTGQMTILHVSKSDEGFYKCSISGLGEAPEIWMKVRASSSTSKATTECTEEPLITKGQLIMKLLVLTFYLVSTLLYFSILRDRARARAAAAANARRRDNNDVIMEVAV